MLRVALVAGVALAAAASPALADGTCGRHNSSGPTACPVNGSNVTYQGSLTPTDDAYPFYDESDYYVFHARKGTALLITVHDGENPTCATEFAQIRLLCGEVDAELDDHSGQVVAEAKGGQSGSATINAAGDPVATTVSATIRRTGTYYLVISGAIEHSIGSSPDQPVPYSFNVSAHPGVEWPAPCVVPRVRRHMTLVNGELAIRHAGCRVGRIVHRYDAHVPAGDVIAFVPSPGRNVVRGTRVRVILATHRRRR